MNKRYLLFLCDHYYPMGGVNDLKDSFTKEEILYLLKNNMNELVDYDYVNIFDLKTMTPIVNTDEDCEEDEGYLYESFNFSLDEELDDIEKLIKIIEGEN